MQYAIFFSDVEQYHLTTESGRTTLCGKVTGYATSELVPVAERAQLMAQPPTGYPLCRYCDEALSNESKL